MQPVLMEIDPVHVDAVNAEGMDISVAYVSPIDELDTELEGRVRLLHELGFVQAEDPIEVDDVITSTALSFASMYLPSLSPLSSRLFVFAVKNSIAKWMPPSSRPGTGRSRGRVDPVASSTASCFASSSFGSTLRPTSAFVTNSMPDSRSSSTRRSTTFLSSFMFGMPYINSP